MIAWVREALIHHVGHHSYFVEAMRQQEDSLDVGMEAIDERPHEEEGRNFSLLIHFLEVKKIFWRGGL